MSETKHTPKYAANLYLSAINGSHTVARVNDGEWTFTREALAECLADFNQRESSDAHALLREAKHLLECVWSGVADDVRMKVNSAQFNPQNIFLVAVLCGTLLNVHDLLARIRAAREGKP